MMTRFIQKILLAMALVATVYAADDFQVEPQFAVVEKAKQFEAKGTLKQKDNGYLYLEVSKEYIADILPMIEAKGKLVPPKHYKSKNGIGAHISVMYENEQIANEIWEIQELGQEFSFTVKELRSVKLVKDNQMKKLWLLAVDAPELEKLRISYGLPAKLKGHDFHITIGTQTPGAPQKVDVPEPAEAA